LIISFLQAAYVHVGTLSQYSYTSIYQWFRKLSIDQIEIIGQSSKLIFAD
jgi:hypothetical protein